VESSSCRNVRNSDRGALSVVQYTFSAHVTCCYSFKGVFIHLQFGIIIIKFIIHVHGSFDFYHLSFLYWYDRYKKNCDRLYLIQTFRTTIFKNLESIR